MQKQRTQKLNVVMSDVNAGKISAYIPPILRHACSVEVKKVVHTVDAENAHKHEALQKNYVTRAEEMAEQADLIIIPGGRDINPRYYGQERHKFSDRYDELSARDEVEAAMIRVALEQDKPLLMICRGYQLGMVLMMQQKDSSKLFDQYIPEHTRGVHRANFYDGDEACFNAGYAADGFVEDILAKRKSPIIKNRDVTHDVGIVPGTITHEIYRSLLELPVGFDEEIVVAETSKHKQGFIVGSDHKLPNGLRCSAISLAGDDVPILEGFEKSSQSMCVGMQWHPEANATGNIADMFRTITDYAAFKTANNDVSFMEWKESQFRTK